VPVPSSRDGLGVFEKTPYNTVAELVAYAKRNPGKLSFGTPGAGGTSHLAGELLNRVAGIDMLHVAYKGSAPAHTDVIGGQVPLLIDPLLSVLPYVKAGRMKIIGVLSPRRVKGA
jgi:tripartite-type tricarboxylate transporter receptor subunit TctC